ncbi:MAG: hypothetical protein OEV66_00485 [Spirochaetia bacterium]|nr:hypothetical protein [Spirochaetia bacterium]
MRRLFFPLVLTVCNVFLISCAKNHGSFAFHSVDERRFTEFQKKNYIPGNFNKYTSPIQFGENQTLWFAFQPGKISHEKYAISLSRKSLGWIEIDLKNLEIPKKIAYLIDNYPNLQAGKYLLTVALRNEILNSIEFEIINERGQRDDFIDYDLPINVVLDSDGDDLRDLSRE